MREKIIEMNEVVANYEIEVNGLLKPLKIKVIKKEDGSFIGETNLGVRSLVKSERDELVGKGDFYRSIKPKKTIEEARECALAGFLIYWNPGKADIEEVKGW